MILVLSHEMIVKLRIIHWSIQKEFAYCHGSWYNPNWYLYIYIYWLLSWIQSTKLIIIHTFFFIEDHDTVRFSISEVMVAPYGRGSTGPTPMAGGFFWGGNPNPKFGGWQGVAHGSPIIQETIKYFPEREPPDATLQWRVQCVKMIFKQILARQSDRACNHPTILMRIQPNPDRLLDHWRKQLKWTWHKHRLVGRLPQVGQYDWLLKQIGKPRSPVMEKRDSWGLLKEMFISHWALVSQWQVSAHSRISTYKIYGGFLK